VRKRSVRQLGQASLEFMILFGFAALMFIFILGIMFKIQVDLRRETTQATAEDMTIALYKELIIAKESTPGYRRTFKIPSDLDGIQYDLRTGSCEDYLGLPSQNGLAGNQSSMKVGSDVVIRIPSWTGSSIEVIQPVVPHTGTFRKGVWNTIENVNGNIFINGNLPSGSNYYSFGYSCWCDKINVESCTTRT
jgi:hypothetical protein